MALTCSCPAATSLTAIPAVQCAENFGQIQKIAFQRLVNGSTKNGFTTSSKITALASWTAAMALATSGKIVISPYIQAPTSEAGAARTFGGGNDTLGGVEEVIGAEPTTFSAVLRGVPQSTIKVMKELMCEAKAGNLGVYLFDENGNIDIDSLYRDLRTVVQNKGRVEVNLPLFGKFTFTEGDVDCLYNCIIGG